MFLRARHQSRDNLDFIDRLSKIIVDYLHIETRVFFTQGTSVEIMWTLFIDYLR